MRTREGREAESGEVVEEKRKEEDKKREREGEGFGGKTREKGRELHGGRVRRGEEVERKNVR